MSGNVDEEGSAHNFFSYPMKEGNWLTGPSSSHFCSYMTSSARPLPQLRKQGDMQYSGTSS